MSTINKIEFSDGLIVQISGIDPSDKLLFKSGDKIECVLNKITPSAVRYINKKTGRQETAEMAVLSNIIIHIQYDRTVSQLTQAAETEVVPQEEEKQEEPEQIEAAPIEEYTIHKGGFADSIIRVAFIAGISDKWDSIDTKEKNAIKSNYYYFLNNGDFSTDGGYYGLDMDLMLPPIKFIQRRTFDLNNIKFGVKAVYLRYSIDEKISWNNSSSSSDDDLDDDGVDDGYNDSYGGKLLEYNCVNAGPEMNIIFSPRRDTFDMLVQLYLTGGYIPQGKLTAVPPLRDAGYSFDKSQYYTEFTGYNINRGAGLHFVFNRVIPFAVGFNIYFGYSKIEFDKKLPVYNNSKSTDFNDGGVNITAGVHF